MVHGTCSAPANQGDFLSNHAGPYLPFASLQAACQVNNLEPGPKVEAETPDKSSEVTVRGEKGTSTPHRGQRGRGLCGKSKRPVWTQLSSSVSMPQCDLGNHTHVTDAQFLWGPRVQPGTASTLGRRGLWLTAVCKEESQEPVSLLVWAPVMGGNN